MKLELWRRHVDGCTTISSTDCTVKNGQNGLFHNKKFQLNKKNSTPVTKATF
jgi:hypothetical protein